jgi:hypothetical protein
VNVEIVSRDQMLRKQTLSKSAKESSLKQNISFASEESNEDDLMVCYSPHLNLMPPPTIRLTEMQQCQQSLLYAIASRCMQYSE